MRQLKMGGVLTLAVFTLVVACGGDEDMNMGDPMAPERLVMDGQYSDERFIDLAARNSRHWRRR